MISVDEEGKPQIEQVIYGRTIEDVLQYVRYDVKTCWSLHSQVQSQARNGSIPKRVAQQMLEGYVAACKPTPIWFPDGCLGVKEMSDLVACTFYAAMKQAMMLRSVLQVTSLVAVTSVGERSEASQDEFMPGWDVLIQKVSYTSCPRAIRSQIAV